MYRRANKTCHIKTCHEKTCSSVIGFKLTNIKSWKHACRINNYQGELICEIQVVLKDGPNTISDKLSENSAVANRWLTYRTELLYRVSIYSQLVHVIMIRKLNTGNHEIIVKLNGSWRWTLENLGLFYSSVY